MMNRYLIKGTAVGALGGLLFGFDTAVIAGATYQLTQVFELSAEQLGITVAIALVGTVIGAMSAGAIGQKFGGRDTLRVLAVLYVISALGSGFAWSWHALLVARFIGGLGIGGSSVLGPVYIAELAPAKWRGRLVGMFQVNVVVGILLAYFSNFVIAELNLGAAQWRWQIQPHRLQSRLLLPFQKTLHRRQILVLVIQLLIRRKRIFSRRTHAKNFLRRHQRPIFFPINRLLPLCRLGRRNCRNTRRRHCRRGTEIQLPLNGIIKIRQHRRTRCQ